jgi:hypothetical protein
MSISKKSNSTSRKIDIIYCVCENLDVSLQKKIKIMGLLDNYTGVGMSPRPKWQHQRVMSRLQARMFNELMSKGFEPLSEATVTDNWDDLAPDIVIFDEHNHPLSIFEIATHKECRQIIKKCYELIARFPESEYFVYDYEAEILYAYDPLTDRWRNSEEEELCSRYLSQPILDYLA